MLPRKTLLQPVLQLLGLQIILPYLRYQLPGSGLLRQKRIDLRNPRLHQDLVRHPQQRKADLLTPMLLRDLNHLPFPLKPDQVRTLIRQELYLKPPGLALGPRASSFPLQPIKKKQSRLLYVKPGKPKRRSSPLVEDHPLLEPVPKLPKLHKQPTELKKLGT